MSSSRSAILRHPERVHPSLWRASQLAPASCRSLSTGHPGLDALLPGGGWPTGNLIEIMTARTGAGEIQLLRPSLAQLESGSGIIFINPPHIPSSVCLEQWLGRRPTVLWLRPQTQGDTLWAAEAVLASGHCAVLLCWIEQAHPASLRRLHLLAGRGNTLFFVLRPLSAAEQGSFSPLRLRISPGSQGLEISFLKRRGPLPASRITLPLFSPPGSFVHSPASHHGSLDCHSPAFATPGQPA